MTTQEIYIKGIRLIEETCILAANVKNGCYSDQQALDANMARMEGLKLWAIANDKIQEIRHFFAANNFGYNQQFVAANLSTMFNN